MIKIGGRNVRVRSLVVDEFFDLLDSHTHDGQLDERAFNKAFFAACLVDKDGKPVFTAAEIGQKLTLPEFRQVEELCTRANSYQEDEGKNSGAGQDGDSS